MEHVFRLLSYIGETSRRRADDDGIVPFESQTSGRSATFVERFVRQEVYKLFPVRDESRLEVEIEIANQLKLKRQRDTGTD